MRAHCGAINLGGWRLLSSVQASPGYRAKPCLQNQPKVLVCVALLHVSSSFLLFVPKGMTLFRVLAKILSFSNTSSFNLNVLSFINLKYIMQPSDIFHGSLCSQCYVSITIVEWQLVCNKYDFKYLDIVLFLLDLSFFNIDINLVFGFRGSISL